MRDLGLGGRLRQADWLLLLLAVVLGGAGVVTVNLAALGESTAYGSAQLRWLVLGVVACLLALAVPYRHVVESRHLIYAGGLFLLVLVLVAGSGKSAHRWLSLGAFSVQPSEIMKVILVIMLAGHIRYGREHRHLTGLIQPLLLTLIPMALIVKQPDLGSALIFLPLLVLLLYVAGAQRKHLLWIAGGSVACLAIAFFVPGLLSRYQEARVHAFLHQSREHRDLLRNRLHHIHQSKTVVGSATALGRGTGEETAEATRFLSERHSDFIFPVFVQAFGLTGTAVLLGLYALLVWRILRTALRVREPSGRLLAVGVGALFASQALVNLAMTIGLLPVVGMPLPFLSYGGTSLLVSFGAVGLVLNVGADHPMEFGRGDFD